MMTELKSFDNHASSNHYQLREVMAHVNYDKVVNKEDMKSAATVVLSLTESLEPAVEPSLTESLEPAVEPSLTEFLEAAPPRYVALKTTATIISQLATTTTLATALSFLLVGFNPIAMAVAAAAGFIVPGLILLMQANWFSAHFGEYLQGEIKNNSGKSKFYKLVYDVYSIFTVTAASLLPFNKEGKNISNSIYWSMGIIAAAVILFAAFGVGDYFLGENLASSLTSGLLSSVFDFGNAVWNYIAATAVTVATVLLAGLIPSIIETIGWRRKLKQQFLLKGNYNSDDNKLEQINFITANNRAYRHWNCSKFDEVKSTLINREIVGNKCPQYESRFRQFIKSK